MKKTSRPSRKQAPRRRAAEPARKSRSPRAKSTPRQAPEISRERLRLIAGFTGKVVGDEPLVQQAQEMAEQARATFGADACVIRLLEGEDLVLLAATGIPREALHPRIPIGWGISQEIIRLRRPVFIRDVGEHPRIAAVRHRLPNPYEFTSYAGTPLLVKEQVIGIFGLYTGRMMDEFSEDDLNLLQIFGNNMSAALLNERLYEQVTRHRDQLEAEITERRRAEAALKDSEERYRRVVEDLSEFVVRWLPDGTRTFVNQCYCRYFGFTLEEAIGSSFLPLMTEKDRNALIRRTGELTPANAVCTTEHQARRPDGEVGWHEWTTRALFDEQGHLREFQSIGRDVTERKVLQEELLQARKMESIGTLAGGIAHDFGNVLAVILGNVSVLQRQPGLSGKLQEALGDIATAAERGSAFTQQLLAYAHGVARQPARIDLNRLVRTVFGLLDRVKPRGIDFQFKLSDDLPPIMADEVQIEQVLMNMGLNAVEASTAPAQVLVETGKAVLKNAAAARLDLPPGTYVCLRVSDRGYGIREEIRDRIFEPFFTTKPMGRGMGLATTRAIVDDHQGRIQVDSAPGQGTCITVWLPAEPPTERR